MFALCSMAWGMGVVLAATRAHGVVEPPKPLQLSELYSATTKPSQDFVTHFHGTTVVDFGRGEPGRSTEDISATYFRRGDSMDVSFTLQRFRQGSLVNTFGRRIITNKDELISSETSENGQPTSAVYSSRPNDHRGLAIVQLQGAEALEGYWAKDLIPFSEALRNYTFSTKLVPAPVTQPANSDNNVNYICLSGAGEYGVYEIYIDRRSNELRYVRVRKRPGDIFGSGRLNGATSTSYRAALAVDYQFALDVNTTDHSSGFQRWDAAKISETTTYSDSRISTIVKQLIRTDFSFRPSYNESGAFDPNLPENFRLRSLDKSGMTLIWQNHQANSISVMDSYNSRLNSALSHAQLSQRSSSKTATIVASVLVGALVTVAMTWYFRRKRPSIG